MSRRERHSSKKSDHHSPEISAITMLRRITAREGYPDPQEREQIIERREELMFRILEDMLSQGDSRQKDRLENYIMQHKERDVVAALSAIERNFQRPNYLLEKAWLYRRYRQVFALFGGQTPFLRYPEYDRLNEEYARQVLKGFKLPLLKRFTKRQIQLRQDLLIQQSLWEDLYPPDPPQRPSNFSAAPAGEYTGPEAELLSLGYMLDGNPFKKGAAHWRPAVPALARMALDVGLLDGWPGEAASWAPYYALQLLGDLRVQEQAANLIRLCEGESDWLSDLLPDVWARMGGKVEPALWKLLDDPFLTHETRGVAAAGLHALAETYPKQSQAIVQGMIARLDAPTAANPEVNAYLAFLLDEMGAVSALPAIEAAFKQGRIAEDIFSPEDLTLDSDEL